MCKSIFNAIIVLLSAISANGQFSVGKKVLTVNVAGGNYDNRINVNLAGPADYVPYKAHSIGAEISFGKINKKNLLVGAGIGISNFFLSLDTNAGIIREGYGVLCYPHIFIQKYKKISNNIYYTPIIQAGIVTGDYDINNEINSGSIQVNSVTSAVVKFKPASFAFELGCKKKVLLNASLGEISFSKTHRRSYEVNVGPGGKEEKYLETTIIYQFLSFAVGLSFSL